MLGELRQAAAAAHDRRSQSEVDRVRIESEAEHLTRTCFSELAMSLEDVVTSVELAGTAQVSEIRDQKSEVRGQRSEVGDQSSDRESDG